MRNIEMPSFPASLGPGGPEGIHETDRNMSAELSAEENGGYDGAETGPEAKLAFAFLWAFLFVAFARPQDFLPGIGLTHLTLVSALLALVAYLGALAVGRARLLRSANLLIVLLLTAWFAIGIPFAIYRGGSFEIFTQTWLRTLLFFFLLTQTLTTISRVRMILWAIVISEVIVSLMSILPGRAALLEGDRLSGVNQGLLGWNFLGITFSVTLPFLAALFVSTASLLQKTLIAAALGSTMWAVILTASRGGFFGFVVSIVVTWWLVLRGSRSGRLLAMLIPIGLIVGVAKAPDVFWSRLQTVWTDSATTETYVLQPEAGNRSANKLSAESAEESTRGRQRLLESSLECTAKFPVFGVGVGAFPLYNGQSTGRPDGWLGTHNTFTQISSEAGIPALVLFLCLLFTVLSQMKRLRLQLAGNEKKAELRLFATATLAGTLIFAFQGFFAHIAYEYLFYYIAGIAAGLWTIAAEDAGRDAKENDRSGDFAAPDVATAPSAWRPEV